MEDIINKVILGNCLDVLQDKVPDSSIDLIVTDPPYGVNFGYLQYYDDKKSHVFDNFEQWIIEMNRVLKDGAHLYVYIPTLEVDKWIFVLKKYFEINNILATQTYMNGKYEPSKFCFDVQLIVYASKGKAKKLNKVDWIETSEKWMQDKRNKNPKKYTYRYPSFIDCMKSNKKRGKQKNLHPNEKNEHLIKKFIELSSNEGDIVLDPFAGSSSTGLAAKMTNRKFICIEEQESFFKISNAKLGIKTEKPLIS